jgi:hypothetical protein
MTPANRLDRGFVDSEIEVAVGVSRDKHRRGDHPLTPCVFTMHGGNALVMTVGRGVAVEMRMHPVRAVMVSVMLVEMDVDERGGQAGNLDGGDESEREEAPAHV